MSLASPPLLPSFAGLAMLACLTSSPASDIPVDGHQQIRLSVINHNIDRTSLATISP
jgi:hypothetical protein